MVEEWIAQARAFGVSSIICLIDDGQLWLYKHSLRAGLLGAYRDAGFDVAHVPAPDQQTEPFSAEQYAAAWEAFQALPKPVLVHCSAGMDRTGRIVSHIVSQMGGEGSEA